LGDAKVVHATGGFKYRIEMPSCPGGMAFDFGVRTAPVQRGTRERNSASAFRNDYGDIGIANIDAELLLDAFGHLAWRAAARFELTDERHRIFPSGLTGAVTDSSGLRHTVTSHHVVRPMRTSSTFTGARSAAPTGADTLSQPRTIRATAGIRSIAIRSSTTSRCDCFLAGILLSPSPEGRPDHNRHRASRPLGPPLWSPDNNFAEKKSIFQPLAGREREKYARIPARASLQTSARTEPLSWTTIPASTPHSE